MSRNLSDIAHQFSRRSRGRSRHLWRLLIALVLIGAGLFAVGIFGLRLITPARADTTLYPQTCLGGWNDPTNAAGPPDVTDGNQAEYSPANSASVSGTLADLYCGGFSGAIPAGTEPAGITLQFSWADVADAVVPTSPDNLASSTDTVLDAPPDAIGNDASDTPADTSPADIIDAAPATDDATTTDNADDTVDTSASTTDPDSTVPPPSDPATGSDDSSFVPAVLDWFSPPRAFAQEDASSTDDSPAPVPEDAVLDVSYTLDGSTWHDLGTVTAFNFADSSFPIPIGDISDWSDLANLQVRVSSLSGLDSTDTVYVDGMTLDVSYGLNQQAPDTLPTPSQLENGDVIPVSDIPAMIVHPEGTTTSSNIIFYQVYPDGDTTYMAEAPAHGDAPLSNYYAPPPPVGNYLMIEYDTSDNKLECDGLSAAACMQDPHFIQSVGFQVVPDATSSNDVESIESAL